MEDMGKENPWKPEKSFFSSSSDMGSENPWAPPEEVGVVHGLARGVGTGLKGDVGVFGKALQAFGANETGKAIEDWSKEGAIPDEQKGWVEKYIGETAGMILPLAAAQFIPGLNASVDLPLLGTVTAGGAAAAGLFAISQGRDTMEAMKAKGLDPGIVPWITGGITGAAMTIIPPIFSKTFTPAIAKIVGEGIAKDTATSLMKPTAGEIIKRFGTAALETQAVFAGQTLGVGGTEKAAGLPHDLWNEFLNSAQSSLGLSLFSVPGIPVRRMIENAHLKTLGEKWAPANVDQMPQDLKDRHIKDYDEKRQGYVDAVGASLEHSGRKDTAGLWHEYAEGQIKNNAPINMDMPLDDISINAEMLQAKTAREMGPDVEEEVAASNTSLSDADKENADAIQKESEPEPEGTPAEEKIVQSEPTSEADYQKKADELGITFNGMQKVPKKGDVPMFSADIDGVGTTFMLEHGESVEQAIARKQQEKIDYDKKEVQSKAAADASEALVRFEQAKKGKTEINNKIKEIQMANPDLDTEGIIKKYISDIPSKAQRINTENKIEEANQAKADTQTMRDALNIKTHPDDLNYILRDLRDNMKEEVAGGAQGVDAEGNTVYAGSGYYDWMGELVKKYNSKKTAPILTKNDEAPGIDAERVRTIIDKGLNDEPLTPYQKEVWKDINVIAERESGKTYAPVLEEMNAMREVKDGLEKEGVDAGTIREGVESATETLRKDLEAKGYSTEDVETVIQELKDNHLASEERAAIQEENVEQKETPKYTPEEIAKNQEMFGTSKALQNIINKLPDTKPEDKVDLVQKMDAHDKAQTDDGKIITEICEDKGKGYE